MTRSQFRSQLAWFGTRSYVGGVAVGALVSIFSDPAITAVAGIALGIAAAFVIMWHTKRFIRRLDKTQPALRLPERTGS
jgi:cytosine/uracil/thiamine/allantoin permease